LTGSREESPEGLGAAYGLSGPRPKHGAVARARGRPPIMESDCKCDYSGGVHRRAFLADLGMGFTGLVLGAMLHRDGVARAAAPAWKPPDGQPVFPPRAKRVIWLFMIGGLSHLESFDPKPALNKYAGKTFAATPYQGVLT